MYEPKEIAYKIKELSKAKGIPLKTILNECDLGVNLISQMAKGQDVRRSNVQKIAEYLGVPLDYLLGKEPTPKVGKLKIPVLGKVQAGLPIEVVENIIDYEEISEEMAKKGDYFALQIQGDSMQPRMFEGDVVIVLKQSTVDSGETAIVTVGDELATCKVVKRHMGGITLMSHNKSYEPMYFTNEQIATLPVTILGKAVEIRGKL